MGREDGAIPAMDDVEDDVLLRVCLGEPERNADTKLEESLDSVPCVGGHAGSLPLSRPS